MRTEILGRDAIPSPYTSVRLARGPRQIRTTTELKPGMVVVKHGIQYTKTGQFPYQSECVINGEPYPDQEGAWWINTASIGTGVKCAQSLADLGVVQYRENLWNKSNWLEDPSRVPAPQE